jgi:hypothetical protein
MTLASLGAAAAGTAIKIYSDKKAGDYEAKVAENNARLAETQRAEGLRIGANEAASIKAQGRAVAGSATTVLGASGVDTTLGSPALSIAASEMNAAKDAETMRSNAARQAWGFANEAQDAKAKAAMIRRGTLLGGVGTALGGVAQGVDIWGRYSRT